VSRLTRVLAVSLIALAVLLGPAAGSASAGVIDYGAIANCRYKVTATFSGTWMRAVLKKIAVEPPTIAKKTGTKSVGWRFIVERSMDRDSTPWVLTYRSPLQHASSSAGLSPMRVSVNVPPEDQTPDGRERVWYRVTIKMFWYGSGGSIQSKTSHTMDDEHIIIGDEEEWIDSICQGAQQQYT
jgi:hypothetical protein